MTREFNKHQRYDSRPPYRSFNSNNTYGAAQSSQPAQPRLNRAIVDRAWVNGAPHRHADYKTRQSHEADAYDRQRPQKSEHYRQQSESSLRDRSPYERDTRNNDQRFSRRNSQPQHTDAFSNRYPGNRQNPGQHFHASADQQERYNQQGKGSEHNTYRDRNDHPNHSPFPQKFNPGRYNQEAEQSDRQTSEGYAYRTNSPHRRYEREQQQPRDRHAHPYNQDERYDRRERFTGGRQQNDFRSSHSPVPPARPSWKHDQQERHERRGSEQFQGDYEQFNHLPVEQSEQHKRYDRQQQTPQIHAPQAEQPVERHMTRLPDGRVLKGPRPAQRKNAQFWTGIANNTDELVKHVQQPAATSEQEADDTKECDEAAPLSIKPHLSTAHSTSSRAQAAQRAADGARKRKTDRPVSNGPRPSKRGFKWPTPPARADE